jgi:anti-sigma-K factor RskA
MTTPTDHNDHDKLRGAEYALGVLDGVQREAFELQMQRDPELRAAVAAWQERLAPLAEEMAEAKPAPYVWARILSELDMDASVSTSPTPESAPARGGFWNNLPLWHWIGIGASAVAVACLVIVFTVPRPTSAPVPTPPQVAVQPPPTPSSYMVAKIEQNNGVAGWTATMDVTHGRMIVVPATPEAVANSKSTQLWLIPPGQKPISLGLIALDKTTSVTLKPALIKQLSAKALLAVSVEPHGGSPTGQPTGPVIAKGALSGA